MFRKKTSLLLILCCCILSGALMALLRSLSAPLWLVFSVVIVLTTLLFWAAACLHADNGRYQVQQTAPSLFRAFPLAVAALCFLLVALLRLPQLLKDAMILSLLQVAAPLLAAAACALRFFIGEAHSLSAPLALVPVYFFCMQLLGFYRSNSNNPDASVFGYEVVALSLLLMGLFMTASSKYKPHHPAVQRFWAMLPLAGVCMELFMLLLAPRLLLLVRDMNAATLFSTVGACALLIMPLSAPIRPVVLPPNPDAAEGEEALVEEVQPATEEANAADILLADDKTPAEDEVR